MRREIKFRAYHRELKQMLNVYVISQGTHAGYEFLPDCRGYYGDNEQVRFCFDVVDWMQYTSLKDKNGKEIYEGDILKFRKDFYHPTVFFTGEVMFDLGKAAYCVDISDGEYFYFGSEVYQQQCEVVGNIYEQLELLK